MIPLYHHPLPHPLKAAPSPQEAGRACEVSALFVRNGRQG